MPDSLRFSQGQKLLRVGGPGREGPLAVDILPGFDRGSDQGRVFGGGSEDHDEIHVRVVNQLVGVTEVMRDAEFFRGLLGRLLPSLEIATTSSSLADVNAGMWP